MVDRLFDPVFSAKLQVLDPIHIGNECRFRVDELAMQMLRRDSDPVGIGLHRLDCPGLLIDGNLIGGVLLLQQGNFRLGRATVQEEAAACRGGAVDWTSQCRRVDIPGFDCLLETTMAMDADTAKYMLAMHDEIEALWRSLEHHSSAAEFRDSARQWREKADQIQKQTDQYRTELAAQLNRLSEDTTRYINVLSVIGYAGYFTTWSFTQDLLDKELTAFVGLMGMISVSTFVLWEVFNVFLRMGAVSALGEIFRNGVSVEDFGSMSEDFTRREAKARAVLVPVHRAVFATSFLTIIAGAVVMMRTLYASL